MAFNIPYKFNNGNTILGHYRIAHGLFTTSGSMGAGSSGIVWSGIFGGGNGANYAVVTRLGIGVEVTTAITTAAAFNFQAFLFSGATGKAAGTSSVTATLSDCRVFPLGMTPTQWGQGNGEMRGLGGSLTTLTAATGKANQAQAFGQANFGALYDTSATGTAVLVSPGAALSGTGAQGFYSDLFVLQPGVNHPIVLGSNQGIEIQHIAAPGATGLSYSVLVEWAEVTQF